MKNNKGKIVICLLASIICLGAIGSTSYYLYKLNNKEEMNEKVTLSLEYRFDDEANSLSDKYRQEVKFSKGDKVDLTTYKIEVEDYKFDSLKENLDENYVINSDFTVVFNYVTSIDVDYFIYTSTTGNEGIYSYLVSNKLSDLGKNEYNNLTFIKNKAFSTYSGILDGFTYNSEKSEIVNKNLVNLYFYKTSGDNPTIKDEDKEETCEHTYGQWYNGKEPTCIEDGYRYAYCLKCGEYASEIRSKTGIHTHSSEEPLSREVTPCCHSTLINQDTQTQFSCGNSECSRYKTPYSQSKLVVEQYYLCSVCGDVENVSYSDD